MLLHERSNGGQVLASVERIYHVPGGRYCEGTTIDESKGERWFCIEAEACNAGCSQSCQQRLLTLSILPGGCTGEVFR